MDQLPDSALVEMAKAGDNDAFAELHTRWFDPVYDFLARMVRNRDEAADIVQDTFLKAMNALCGLQSGASFRGWIFSIARKTALNRIESSGPTRPLAFQDGGNEVSLDAIDTDRLRSPEEAAEASAVAALVWEAAARLDPRQLMLLDLHLRQGLDVGEIAEVVGVTKNNGDVILSRLKKAAEDAIAAFIMFKDGRRCCQKLDALLSVATVEGMSPDVRKLVDGHLTQCGDCQERREKLVSPLAVFGAFAAVPAPLVAKARGLDRLMREWPGPAAGSGGELPPPPQDGFGTGAGPDDGADKPTFGEKSKLLNGTTVVGAGIAALLLLGAVVLPASPLSPLDDDDTAARQDSPEGNGSAAGAGPTASPTGPKTASTGPGSASPTATPSATPTTAAGGATAPAANQTPTPIPGPGTPTPTLIPTGTATSTATPTGTATATPTTIPCAPILFTNTPAITIQPGGSSSFEVRTSCGTANYVISGGDGWAITFGGGTVTFPSANLLPVNVGASGLGEGFHSTVLSIEGPHNTASVTVNTTVPGSPPAVNSFSATCEGSTGRFVANVTDDYAVQSVTVSYTLSNDETGLVSLSQSGNDWDQSIALPEDTTVTSATLTATDFAGHTASGSASC